MTKGKFKSVAATPKNKNWEKLTTRAVDLYSREDDVRSPFARDYTRILHSLAYRRLKHKTQVFFNIDNDHICTRMEHVAHVESVSHTIAKSLGLNDELTKAIAMGHDLGHAPFGHQGESVISELSNKHLGEKFWHERNGLRFVDKIELLEDNYKKSKNLDLTYAVRDGIISHCGEVDENGLTPRDELIDLGDFTEAGQYQPATWEGCVVKISDKIAYVGRDIEDAINLGFLNDATKNDLLKMARANDQNVLNTTVIMHNLIIDICENSSPEKGICLSSRFLDQINSIKDFNYKHIYGHERLVPFKEYSKLVINQIFEVLKKTYDGRHSWASIKDKKKYYPILMDSFDKWLARYCEVDIIPEGELLDIALNCENEKIYGELENEKIYIQAILDFISGMTDRFAIKVFNELLNY
ncbi:HD domain-containing protein [Dorea sp. YH-dor228]|uniref:deoxyguanosinetriphosphate triphosphohydrolase family protein n=1 Tax=Dorea sp. YH-dor228 TaxID=3151120 RepID=UPI003241E543